MISEIQQCNTPFAENRDFMMKENFNIKLRKTAPPSLEVRVCYASSVDQADTENAPDVDENIIEPSYWLVLRKGIEGVKSFG